MPHLVRAAQRDDLAAMAAIERTAGEAFREVGLPEVADDEPMPAAASDHYVRSGRAWVAEAAGTPIGYLLVELLDGQGHIEQVSVTPDQQGTGVGRALVHRAERWAATQGCAGLTLTTFSDVAWNRPLYEHLGFRVLAEAEIGPELRQRRAAEADHGLDPAGRVCMRREVTAAKLPPAVGDTVGRYLALADEAAPGLIEAFYVVGSTALDAFRPERSDIDFVAVVPSGVEGAAFDRLRPVHRRAHREGVARALLRVSPRWPQVCNGVFVRADDLGLDPRLVAPLGSHVAGTFSVGQGFDVNPVTWRTLRRHGITVRGPAAASLEVFDDDEVLHRWTRANLDYWRRWSAAVQQRQVTATLARFRHLGLAWGVLGAPRLHATIATGEIISKEAAGEYALATFDPAWHPLIAEALAYWRGEHRGGPFSVRSRPRETAAFVAMVVASAESLPG